MAATTSTKPRPRRSVQEPLPCKRCDLAFADDTDLSIHLVTEHEAVWTSTNSFGLNDLIVPMPREAMHDDLAEEPSWVRRLLLRRTA